MPSSSPSRREFVKSAAAATTAAALSVKSDAATPKRPNILFAFADDWMWPHAGVYGEPVVQTPAFDRVAREGVLFRNAFVASPSCTPSRAAILTGQWHWRLEESANLWSTLQAKFPVYPDLLEAAGYHVGYTRKGWGPGDWRQGGRQRNPAGPQYKNFTEFLTARPQGAPFCFWFGSHDPHRPYKAGSGVASGMDPDKVRVPPYLPDHPIIRSDVCDYFFEVQRFDRETGEMLAELERRGELDNTLVVVSGDNGMPFPRCKTQLYDSGTRAPLAARWPARIPAGRVVDDFVSLCDLAPTFLEAAGLAAHADMTARSFMNVLTSDRAGLVDPARDHVLTGRERHTVAQEAGMGGYPCRAYRTRNYLYIRNFRPDRWPSGAPQEFRDIDGSPTKTFLLDHRDDPAVRPFFEMACAKRPAEELYDLRHDPHQLHNIATDPRFAAVCDQLSAALMAELRATNDPRVLGRGDELETYPYLGRRHKPKPKPR